ncbi:MAG: toll/interleukin-1 receptor domain-containing protein [Elainellaceae cyanobacterium]
MSPSATPKPDHNPIEIFISFSHKDDALQEELVTHLSGLRRRGKITAWYDRAVEAGEEWEAQIKSKLESAQIILMLISPAFMASDYCYDIEMQRAMARHDAGTARVIPVILRPCDWKDSPFGKLKAMPEDGKPVTQWSDRDEAFLNAVQGIRRALESLSKK